jgi:hypothetical protein
MYAWQFGASALLPRLPFASLQMRYTKIEPYNYTHLREKMPWYGDTPMITSYTNSGKSLGYYLPPNSDELLLRFETMPSALSSLNFQYQMIRHGAEYGRSAVDGSSLQSELDPSGRDTKSVLKKSFLQDGAYQWQHVLKIGGDYRFPKTPVQVFAEAGVVLSYFTDIDGPDVSVTLADGTPVTVNKNANFGDGRSHNYSVIDTAEYPKSNTFIASIGVRIFP